MDTYETLRAAILNREVVCARYNGYYRVMCPHALGIKNGRRKVLVYQFDGESSQGLEPDGSPANWRCFFVDELRDVVAQAGAWHTSDRHSRRQTCIGRIDVEVLH